jgi:hypothetical protein
MKLLLTVQTLLNLLPLAQIIVEHAVLLTVLGRIKIKLKF